MWMDYCFGHHNYLQFACSVELYGLLLWSPILPINRPSLPKPHRNWFTVVIESTCILVNLSTEIPLV